MQTTKDQRGFTLVELMVTVAILAILMGIAAPNLASFLSDKSAEAAAQALASDLKFARSEAMKRGVPMRLCGVSSSTSNAGAVSYSCLADNVTNWTPGGWMVVVASATNTPLRLTNTPNGIASVTASLGATPQLVFNPNGILVGGGGNIVLAPKSDATANQRKLTLNSTGRVRIDKGATSTSTSSSTNNTTGG
jgi:type IV fimbrial biogenesis protein FimT